MIFEHSISRTIPYIYLPLLFYTMARLTNHKPFPTMLSFLRRSVCTAMHICVIWFLFGIKKKKNGKNRSLFKKKIFLYLIYIFNIIRHLWSHRKIIKYCIICAAYRRISVWMLIFLIFDLKFNCFNIIFKTVLNYFYSFENLKINSTTILWSYFTN